MNPPDVAATRRQSYHRARPFLWAHRGASCGAPENTMVAFAAALEAGADGIEFDVHLSGDGVPVVIHDDTLDRTTDASGPVGGAPLALLRQVDAGSWFGVDFAGEPVPTLEEVLTTFGGLLRLNVEIKAFDAGMAVLELLRRHPAADSVVSSFDHRLLARLRAADARLPLAVLSEAGHWRNGLTVAVALSAQALHPAAADVSRPLTAACRRARLAVYPWTVDEPGLARSMRRAGVDGLFTNDPAGLGTAFERGRALVP